MYERLYADAIIVVESTRKEAYESNAMISDVIKGKGGGLIIVLVRPCILI